jgi:SNF2 family DNA or RNA helicase
VMDIAEIISSVITRGTSSARFEQSLDSLGINFILPIKTFDACQAGDGSDWMLHQYVYLKMLEEQGVAEQIRNGFSVSSEEVVNLEKEAWELLELPARFPGSFVVRVEGQTFNDRFDLEIIPVFEDGQKEPTYQIKGPMLQFGGTDNYLLSAAQYNAFEALARYRASTTTETSEKHNLKLIGDLQRSQADGMKINLAQFDKFDIQFPQVVGATGIEQDDGSITLVPSFGADSDPIAINNALHQVTGAKGDASLRVGNKIILLDEKRLKATQEIIANRKIKKEDVKAFLASPSSFLDASLIDLDIGFSLRVHGAVEFKHGYFGETDESGIDWMSGGNEKIFTPSQLNKLVETGEDLDRFVSQFKDATTAGAQQIHFANCLIDISDKEQVEQVIDEIRRKLESPREEPTESGSDGPNGEDEKPPTLQLVVDIDLNDEEASFALQQSISDVSYEGAINFAAYKFVPYSYQEAGIRWILGLAQKTLGINEEEVGKHGALLADDMGLGKTFMALVAVKEYQALAKSRGETERPVLMVGPLSLLENWRDEIKAVYGENESPFDSIVTLQADADLRKYKTGKGVETRQLDVGDDNGAGIRYSLKVGSGADRLDMPRRLVLTTYETLRDYQFSLSRIDWSFVIFDEAQRIKNPNALWTRAAKALKARFKLLATGTPVENHLGDFWCLLDTARPGELGAYQQFRETYIKPIAAANDEEKPEVRGKLGRELRMAVGPSMLRRIKEDQLDGLPTKTIYVGEKESSNGTEYLEVLACQMSTNQRKRYDTVIGIVQQEQESEERSHPVLMGLHRLQDVSLHPLLLDGGTIPMPKNEKEARQTVADSGKLLQTFALLDEIKSKKEKVIIFAINKRLQSFLKVACERVYGIKVSIINGDTKAVAKKANTDTRKSLITAFEAADDFGVIVMSPIAAGMGLTVVGANNVIHIQRHWNPAKEAQATDRVYRIGQTRDVNVYLPILQHPELCSFDVNLNRLLNQKSALKDAVVTPEEVKPTDLAGTVFGGAVKKAEPEYIKVENLHHLSWEQFEAFAVELYAAVEAGEALLTKAGTDSGADGLVWSPNGNILIQVKHTESSSTISEDAAAQVYKAKPLYEAKTGKMFKRMIAITNAKAYSSNVRSNAKNYGVELVTHKDIKKLLRKYPIELKVVTLRLGKKRLDIS